MTSAAVTTAGFLCGYTMDFGSQLDWKPSSSVRPSTRLPSTAGELDLGLRLRWRLLPYDGRDQAEHTASPRRLHVPRHDLYALVKAAVNSERSACLIHRTGQMAGLAFRHPAVSRAIVRHRPWYD